MPKNSTRELDANFRRYIHVGPICGHVDPTAQMRIYKFWDRPVGPHPVPMFEVNTFTPIETGALFGFLTVWRGPLSYVVNSVVRRPSLLTSGCHVRVLVHPNTGNVLKDHTELCTWMGRPWPIDTSFLHEISHS